VLDCCGATTMLLVFYLILRITSRRWFERPV